MSVISLLKSLWGPANVVNRLSSLQHSWVTKLSRKSKMSSHIHISSSHYLSPLHPHLITLKISTSHNTSQPRLLLKSIQIKPHPLPNPHTLPARRRKLRHLKARRLLIQKKSISMRSATWRRLRTDEIGYEGTRGGHFAVGGAGVVGLEPVEDGTHDGEGGEGWVHVEGYEEVGCVWGGGVGDAWGGLGFWVVLEWKEEGRHVGDCVLAFGTYSPVSTLVSFIRTFRPGWMLASAALADVLTGMAAVVSSTARGDVRRRRRVERMAPCAIYLSSSVGVREWTMMLMSGQLLL